MNLGKFNIIYLKFQAFKFKIRWRNIQLTTYLNKTVMEEEPNCGRAGDRSLVESRARDRAHQVIKLRACLWVVINSERVMKRSFSFSGGDIIVGALDNVDKIWDEIEANHEEKKG